MSFDKDVVVYLNSFRYKPLDKISQMISDVRVMFLIWIIFLSSVALADFNLGLNIFLQIALVFIVHYTINEGLIKFGLRKLSLLRVRPYVAYPNEIKAIGKNFSISSFPSSHLSSVTGGMVVLYSAFPGALPLLIFIIISLSLSRIHNGMHYPSDVLAGIVIGIFYGSLTLFLWPKFAGVIEMSMALFSK